MYHPSGRAASQSSSSTTVGEKITEDQVANLLASLRTDASVETKLGQFNSIKSGIKHNNVPEPGVAPLFEAIRTSMSSQHASLVYAGFSTLSHLLMRLSRQEPKHLQKEATRTLPLIIEKSGDQSKKYKTLATQCLTTFWLNKGATLEVERVIKNVGLVGKNPRTKETLMEWIAQMHQDHDMPFKSYVTTLMELLEDADGMVRDTARITVIELFQDAPNPVKADLKKQLKIFNVRPAIVSAIVGQLAPGSSNEVDAEPIAASRASQFANSVSSTSNHRPTTPVQDVKLERVEPLYVHTQRELEDTFKEMHVYFEGKESEANWLKREQSCTKLRRLNAGNATDDFHDAFLAGIKSLLDGILKAVNSLRTSLSKEGCSVVQEVARMSGPGLDPMVEILLQNLIKLCGGTKKISSQQGNMTVDILISRVSYSLRIMQHIWFACQDKNVQPRTYATGWLKTLLNKEAHHKSHVEHTGGLELAEKCIKKGLADANPGVRENMRSTYWSFARIWPSKAESIMSALDATQQRLLEQAPDNPNSPPKVDASKPRPGLGFSKSTNGPPKPSLRETMLAQKKATMATKNLPARPGSAMSSFTPVRTVSTSSTISTKTEAASSKQRPEPAVKTHGGLSVAPMRPTKFKRPEIARPATAGPYSVRRPGHAPSNSDSTISPSAPKMQKARTPSANNSPSKRSVPRPNTSHSHHASQSSHASPAKPASRRVDPSAKTSPAKPRSTTLPGSSPSKADEDFTMVVPTLTGLKEPKVASSRDSSDDEAVTTPAKGLKVYEDPFSSTDDQTTPRPIVTAPVLEEVPLNEDASNIARNEPGIDKAASISPERLKQSFKLLDSAITKIKAKLLDVHGFRKLQGMIRDNKAMWSGDRFDLLLLGLFEYLEAPLASMTADKVQDVKAQILATIKLMYKKDREAFRPYVSRGLQSILATRSSYDSRSHIVSGLELLAGELIIMSSASDSIGIITTRLRGESMSVEGCRSLSMGLHVLREVLEVKKDFIPSDTEIDDQRELATRCLESSESGVRSDAVQLCVSMHARLGESKFWETFGRVKDDPKSLITYYVVKRQREAAASA